MKPFDLVALEAQIDLIQSTLETTDYNMSRTAEILRIDRKTLYNKLKSYKEYIEGIEASASS